jgi:hypothetical protein
LRVVPSNPGEGCNNKTRSQDKSHVSRMGWVRTTCHGRCLTRLRNRHVSGPLAVRVVVRPSQHRFIRRQGRRQHERFQARPFLAFR